MAERKTVRWSRVVLYEGAMPYGRVLELLERAVTRARAEGVTGLSFEIDVDCDGDPAMRVAGERPETDSEMDRRATHGALLAEQQAKRDRTEEAACAR